MAATKRTTLEDFITRSMNDPDKDHPCSMFSLVHMQGGSQGKELHAIKIKEGGTYDPKRMADVFRGRAESYAQDLLGVQTFNLIVFYGKTEPEAFQPFLVNIRSDSLPSGLSTESPTAEGQTQQNMRQREMLFQQVYNRQQQMDSRSDRLLEILTHHNERLQSENMQAFFGLQQMMMRMQEADDAKKMEIERYRRSTEERAKMLMMAPPLVNMIAGKEVFPQSTADTALVEALATSINPEHLNMLLPMLPEAVQGLVAQRMQAVLQKKREEEEARKSLPVFRGNPEDEIGGGQ